LNSQEIERIDRITKLIHDLLNGNKAELIDIENQGNGEVGQLTEFVNRLAQDINSVSQFARNISTGKLEQERVSKLTIAQNLKNLQATLRHLSWQTDQVAKGDFTQRVDFLGTFSTSFNWMVEQLKNNRKKLAEQMRDLEKLYNELQTDLAIAAEAQQATMRLLENDAPFLRCCTLFRPYGEVSGDFYDEFLNDSKDILHAFLGDATGHGTSAALVSMMAKMGLSNMPDGLSTDDILRRLNEMMASCVPLGKFVTGIYLRIDSEGVLTSSNAGHPPLLIIPEDGGAPVAVESNGMALGMVKEEIVPYKEHTCQLKPGDRVYIYTDGIVECAAGSDMFGEDRLASFLAEKRSEDMDSLLKKLLEVLTDFSGTDKFNDDVTILGFQFLKSVK